MRPYHSVSLTALLISSAVYAQPGTLDPSFGDEGVVSLYYNNENTLPMDLAVLPDGRIMAVSMVHNDGRDIALTRLHPDGSLDGSFGTDGVVQVGLVTAADETPRDMHLLDDGRMIVAGTLDQDFFVTRLNADGSVDPTFGNDGHIRMDHLTGAVDYFGSMVVRPTGEIVVSNSCSPDFSNGYGIVVQYTADGILDPSFGSNGVLIIDHIDPWDEGLQSMVLAIDGSLVIVGNTFNTTNDEIHVYRVTPGGILDPNFSDDGIVALQVGDDQDQNGPVMVRSDGRILTMGTTLVEGLNHLFMAYLEADGSLDTDFGTNGVWISPTLQAGPGVLIPLAAGGYLVSGSHFTGTGSQIMVARFTDEDLLDPTFGEGGLALFQIGGEFAQEGAGDLVFAGNGNYLVNASTGVGFAGTSTHVILSLRSGQMTSIHETEQAGPTLFPNPASKEVIITEAVGYDKLHLVDTNGRTIVTRSINAQGPLRLAIGHLPPGPYVLKLSGGSRAALTRHLVVE